MIRIRSAEAVPNWATYNTKPYVMARHRAYAACRSGPDAMQALLDDLGRRIAAERAKHGIPDPDPVDLMFRWQIRQLARRMMQQICQRSVVARMVEDAR